MSDNLLRSPTMLGANLTAPVGPLRRQGTAAASSPLLKRILSVNDRGGKGGLRRNPTVREEQRIVQEDMSILDRLEVLLKPIEARRNLTASLVQNKSDLSGRLETFQDAKAHFERIVRGDEHKPVQLQLEDPPTPPKRIPHPVDEENPLYMAKPAARARRRRRSTVKPAPPAPMFIDATNLSMVFKAFQPCIDQNLPPVPEAEDCLKSVLDLPDAANVYKRFAVKKLRPQFPGRNRRRNLMRRQLAVDAEDMADGGVAWAALRLKGRNGDITPVCFKMVMKSLTEGRLSAALLLTLFDWLDSHEKEAAQAIDLNEFLNILDDLFEEHQKEIVKLCFSKACAEGETVISKRSLLEKVIPAKQLSDRQAFVLLDHFPQCPPPRRAQELPPPLSDEEDVPPEIKVHQIKAHQTYLDRRLHDCANGPVMTKAQFEVTLEQSPFLLIAFLDVLVRFAANKLSEPTWNKYRMEQGQKPTALELMGPVW